MILVYGGAYNGKLEFVKEKYELSNENIFFCNDNILEFDKPAICGLHIFIRSCSLKETNPLEILENNIGCLENKIIICDDINSGIVPMEKIDRKWREDTGQALQFLSRHAVSAYRVFFGLYEQIK